MKKKMFTLSLCSFAAATLIFILTYFMYHYLAPTGFSSVLQTEPGKPFITLLFGIWGVLFLFASIFSLFVYFIFFSGKK